MYFTNVISQALGCNLGHGNSHLMFDEVEGFLLYVLDVFIYLFMYLLI